MLEYRVAKNKYAAEMEHPSIFTHQTEMTELEGRLVIALVEKWGMVSVVDDGEDSAGRAKLRLATPEEVVTRAAEVVELIMDQLHDRGWVLSLPTITEMENEVALARKVKAAKASSPEEA